MKTKIYIKENEDLSQNIKTTNKKTANYLHLLSAALLKIRRQQKGKGNIFLRKTPTHTLNTRKKDLYIERCTVYINYALLHTILNILSMFK